MPKSFVDQAVARTLSEPEARYWFNCNPESAEHWFYKEWICNTRQKKALHLHFTMQDNPILSPEQIADAERLYTGVFYNRYIKGLWCVAEGLIYPMFDKTVHVKSLPHPQGEWYVSVDYGTLNAFSAGCGAMMEQPPIGSLSIITAAENRSDSVPIPNICRVFNS